MALSNSKGGVPPQKHKLERSNIERDENDAANERRAKGIQRYPMDLYKGKLTRQVQNDDEEADARAKGWMGIHELAAAEPSVMPERVFQMSVQQAEAFIAEHATDGEKLAAIQADEQSHGNRKAVIDLIMAAADALDVPKAKPAAPKPAKKK